MDVISGHGRSELKTDQAMDVFNAFTVGPWMLSTRHGLNHSVRKGRSP